ncbi:MAG: nucleotidyl transferase AbiEii/AbiGii toxin family protein [Polyangiaceae bacterium]
MGKPAGLAKDQQRALGRLTKLPELRDFYLAGGSAIAWHLRHRRSNDLDLFSERRVDLGRVERALKKLPGVEVLSISDVTIKIELDGTLVDVVAYPYPPLEEPMPGPEGSRVASLLDLAVMKLGAVARRGIRRDFWDLRVLAESGLPLVEIARAYRRRFRVSEGDLYPVLRALTYFEDAEKDATLPAGMTLRSWQATKRFFVEHAGDAVREMLSPEPAPEERPPPRRRSQKR